MIRAKSSLMQILLVFFSMASLCFAEGWHLELKDNTIINFTEEAKIKEGKLHIDLDGRALKIPLKDVVSLKKRSEKSEFWIYENAVASSFDTAAVSSAMIRLRSKTHRGNGVLIHPEGYILTNQHLIAGDYDITATHNGTKTYPVRIFAQSKYFDLAILKVDLPEGEFLPYVKMGNDKELREREDLFAVASTDEGTWQRHEAVLSKKYQYFGIEDSLIYQQLDLKMRPDNSGSPVFNKKGQLVGLLTHNIRSARLKGQWFSIPVSYIKLILQNTEAYIHDPSKEVIKYNDINGAKKNVKK